MLDRQGREAKEKRTANAEQRSVGRTVGVGENACFSPTKQPHHRRTQKKLYKKKRGIKTTEDMISATDDKKLKDSYENLKKIKQGEEAAAASKH